MDLCTIVITAPRRRPNSTANLSELSLARLTTRTTRSHDTNHTPPLRASRTVGARTAHPRPPRSGALQIARLSTHARTHLAGMYTGADAGTMTRRRGTRAPRAGSDLAFAFHASVRASLMNAEPGYITTASSRWISFTSLDIHLGLPDVRTRHHQPKTTDEARARS